MPYYISLYGINVILKKSGNKANTSSGEDHEMALPLVKKYWFPNQRCESTIKHSSMLVLCNQAFTNDTFMQLVNDKAGILLQYKLEVIYLCIRERPKFTFGTLLRGLEFLGPVVWLGINFQGPG